MGLMHRKPWLVRGIAYGSAGVAIVMAIVSRGRTDSLVSLALFMVALVSLPGLIICGIAEAWERRAATIVLGVILILSLFPVFVDH